MGLRKTEQIGVYITPAGNYMAKIQANKRDVYLGTYSSFEEACKVREEALTHKEDYGKPDEKFDAFPLLPLEKSCVRCSRERIPGSQYCKYHDARKANFAKEQAYRVPVYKPKPKKPAGYILETACLLANADYRHTLKHRKAYDFTLGDVADAYKEKTRHIS